MGLVGFRVPGFRYTGAHQTPQKGLTAGDGKADTLLIQRMGARGLSC